VIEDEYLRGGRRGFRAFGRLHWHVNAIRTCRRHEIHLVSSAELAKAPFQHDFAANIAAEAPNMPGYIASAEAAGPDGLQNYVENRLKGIGTRAEWLDAMPLYVAIRLCEMVGASLLHGKLFRSSQFGNREWSESSGAGYDLLEGGEQAFRRYLETQVDEFHRGANTKGERSIFGRLHLTLAHHTPDPAFDPIRDIVRDVAIDKLALGPGDDFFGPVTVRKYHTIHSASKAHGIPFERLNKLVLDAGLLPSDATSGSRKLIDAEAFDHLVKEMSTTLNQTEAVAKLGVTRKVFRMLVSGGVLKPLLDVKPRDGAKIVLRFQADQIVRLLEDLRSAVTCTDIRGLTDLHTSAKNCGCTIVKAIELIRSGKLSRVGWNESGDGVAALRVDPIEMRPLLLRKHLGAVGLRKFGKLTRLTKEEVRLLIEDGHINVFDRRSPTSTSPQQGIEKEDLEKFMSEFGSLKGLAGEHGILSWTMRKRLEDAGVAPAFTAGKMPFYRRDMLSF
jgi:predicted DNA-binding antitoxin AbrB/MazE fold protein